jgi:RHS repeat-associated protein
VAVELAADLSAVTTRYYDEFGNPETTTGGPGQKARYGWLGGAQRSGEALGDVLLMGVRLYSPVLGRFLQVDPQPDGNASAYDYCNADPVNCTDLDGKWGWRSLVSKVAKVAEYASWIPGPIGSAAAAVSSIAYAATGNYGKALEMGLTAAAGFVGAGAAVRVGFKAARIAMKARRFSSIGRRVFRAASRGCNSFTPETAVVMADGTILPIEDVQVGDLVLALDPMTGSQQTDPVIDVITGSGTRHLVDIVLADGATFTATAEHPIWIEGKGWVKAGEITPGDRTRGATGGLLVVAAMHDRGWLSGQTVYNLTVANAHTFVIATADGTTALVHNSSCWIAGHHVPHSRGVYVIHFKNGKKYVGSSRNMHRRLHRHFGAGGRFHGGQSGVSHITHHAYNGRQLRRYEQSFINRYGGVRGGRLYNKINAYR